MKINARKFATWLIALAIVMALYSLAGDGETLLASGFGVGILVIGMVFRRAIFGTVHRVVERTVDTQATKLFGEASDPGEPFDFDGAIQRHLEAREDEAIDPDAAFDRYMKKRAAGEVTRPPTTQRPTFGRKRA